jgi:hypothetical protein
MAKFEDIVSKDKVSGFWEAERKRQEIESKKGLWVYDVESYPNFFSYTAIRTDSHQYVCFELSPWKDDKEAMLAHLKTQVSGMVGFNNVHYDQYLISAFMDEFIMPGIQVSPGEMIARRLYGVSQGVIGRQKGAVNPYSACSIPQLDLFLLNHYNNKNKTASLKSLMVRFGWKNVEDLPYHWSTELEKGQVEKVLEYNLNDVLFTKFFYEKCGQKIELRRKLGTKLKRNLFNASDVGIGETIFLKKLSDKMDLPIGALRKMGSPAKEVPLESVILPHITFSTPEFSDLLQRMKGTTVGADQIQQYKDYVTSLAGGMSTNDLAELLEDRGLGNNRSAKKGKKKKGADKKGFAYRVVYNNFTYEYGIGGVHGCITPGLYRSDDQYVIVDTDAASYYPNIAIRNKLSPRHLNKEVFCKTYEEIYDERIEAKGKGDAVTADGLKLALNGVFGKSGDKYSPFYDPYLFMGITINGQLMLTMFAEMVELASIGAQILQINTDGVTFRVPRVNLPTYHALADKWQELNKIPLEHNEYEVMAIRDVNNYLAKDVKGKIKEKGSYETEPDWHKNDSFRIVRIAARNYLLDGTPIADTFAKEQDIFAYCGRYKATPGFHPQYVFLSEDEYGNAVEKRSEFGKTLRFIPVKKGGVCVKKHDDGRQIELLAGWRTMPYNKAVGISHSDIDMNFFHHRTIEKIQEIIVPQTSLF